MVFLSTDLLKILLGKGGMQHGLYQCIALCACLPSQWSFCQRSIIVIIVRVWGGGCYRKSM